MRRISWSREGLLAYRTGYMKVASGGGETTKYLTSIDSQY